MKTIFKQLYIIFLISGFYGQHYLNAQQSKDTRLTTAYYEKQIPSIEASSLALRFGSIQNLMNVQPKLMGLIKNMEGKFECRMKLSLRKEKVLSVRLFLSKTKHLGRRIKWKQRRQLKRCFRQLQFMVKAQPQIQKLPKRYKTSWLFSVKDGELKYL